MVKFGEEYATEKEVSDYAEDIASRLRANQFKEAAKLWKEFKNIFGENELSKLARRLQYKDITDYDLYLMTKEF